MNNSYESDSVISSNSNISYDLNTGFHEESSVVTDSMVEYYYLEATHTTQALETELKKTKNQNFAKNCKKICSSLIKPISNKINKLKVKSSETKESISEDKKIKLEFPARAYLPNKCEVNFNTEQFANAGDIFYCYI